MKRIGSPVTTPVAISYRVLRFVIISSLSMVVVGGMGMPAHAMSGVSINSESISSAASDELRVSPTLISIDTATHGTKHAEQIRIYNRRSTNTTFTIDMVGLAGSPDPLRRIVFLQRNDPADRMSARAWVTPAARTITLRPHEVATVPLRLMVPRNARPGGHYAAVVVRALARRGVDAPPGGQVGVETEMAIPVLAVVPGRVRRSVEIHEVAAPGSVASRARWTATIVLENTGEVHARPRGSVTITSLFGREVARTSLGGRILLPSGRDRSQVSWAHAPWLGRYTITVRAGAQSSRSDTVSRTIWVVPPWWCWVVLAGLVLGWTVINRRSRGGSLDDGDA